MERQEELIPLISGRIILEKAVEGDKEGFWRFAGVASDEETDIDGDSLTKSVLDLSYAQKRGFVNWNHSRKPEDQLGFLTKAELIEDRSSLEKKLGVSLTKSATVYVEGELYRMVPQAQAVRNIMMSVRGDYTSGLALSVDGVLAKSSDQIVKAYVRGVAITPAPAQLNTFCQLRKAIADMGGGSDKLGGMSEKEAVLWVLEKNPSWTYGAAKLFVTYVLTSRKES